MDINENEQREMIIYAFRYALGRMTYSVSTMVRIIDNNWDNLSKSDRELIQREIQDAIVGKWIGMKCDKELWETILNK